MMDNAPKGEGRTPEPWYQAIMDFLWTKVLPENPSVANKIKRRSLRKKGSWRSNIMRSGIFWPSIDKDAQDHVRRYDPCQRHANIPHQPPHDMVSMLYPRPFYHEMVTQEVYHCGGRLFHQIGGSQATHPAGSGVGVPILKRDLHVIWGTPGTGHRQWDAVQGLRD
ncbi:hypothetical protein LIER_17624 [Lithospermum erythrorhizon]|uniref:Uncharacterized protein n=1 Tax=Lithospermum erythrorhizon TaxID=34254 RepID=A0AAV3QDE1_LITER